MMYMCRFFSFITIVFISITSVLGQSVNISKSWIKTVQRNGENGVEIHAVMDISGMKGKTVGAYLYVFDSAKRPLVNANAKKEYRADHNNQLSLGIPFACNYNVTRFNDAVFFIPFSQFPLSSGTANYSYHIKVYCNKWLYGGGNFFPLTISWPQQNSNSVNQNLTSNQRFISYDCPHCGKTGRCRQCNGTGRNLLALRNGIFSPCASCWGTLKCSACGGTGTWVVDNYSSGSVSTGNYGGGYSSGSTGNYGGGNNSSGYDSSGKRKCAICNGTGNCDQCAGRGERRLGGDGQLVDCWRCHGTGKCQICYGDGYKYR